MVDIGWVYRVVLDHFSGLIPESHDSLKTHQLQLKL